MKPFRRVTLVSGCAISLASLAVAGLSSCAHVGGRSPASSAAGTEAYFSPHEGKEAFERMYSLTQDVVKLKRHFRVSYLVILHRLAAMGIIEFAQEKAKICAIYQKQHHGESLQNSMELPPAIGIEEYPENERYECLIWQCLKMGKISEIKAAELLNLTVEKLRVRRQENQVYAIA